MGCRLQVQNHAYAAVAPSREKRAFIMPRLSPHRCAQYRCGPSACHVCRPSRPIVTRRELSAREAHLRDSSLYITAVVQGPFWGHPVLPRPGFQVQKCFPDRSA